MNVQVKHNSTDITTQVLNYNRTQNICTGIGTVVVNVVEGRSYDTWDTITIWEGGVKKGIFNIASIESLLDGSVELSCQDNSKRMQDYFIYRTYKQSVETTSKYWIEKFLKQAKLNYQFTVSGTGEKIAINTSFGMNSCYEEIIKLLQLNAWYFYADENGKIVIGDIKRNIENYSDSINDSDINQIGIHKDDTRLRNRAVVWGNADPLTGTHILVDLNVRTPWNYDSKDKRAVVMANSMIRDYAIALGFAHELINEYSSILYTKIIQIHSTNSIKIGDSLYVRSIGWNGVGRVTTVGSEVSPDGGVVTNIVLDERCPRLWAYFNYWGVDEPIYVYIGTRGAGIWRRLTDSYTWEDNSSGLGDDLNIKDLFIKDGNFVCVTMSGGVYTRTVTSNYWVEYEHPDLLDKNNKLFPAGAISGVACSINADGNIVVGYNHGGKVATSGDRAWVLEFTPFHALIRAEQVIVQELQNQRIYDLEALPEYNIVSTAGGVIPSGINPEFPPLLG